MFANFPALGEANFEAQLLGGVLRDSFAKLHFNTYDCDVYGYLPLEVDEIQSLVEAHGTFLTAGRVDTFESDNVVDQFQVCTFGFTHLDA